LGRKIKVKAGLSKAISDVLVLQQDSLSESKQETSTSLSFSPGLYSLQELTHKTN